MNDRPRDRAVTFLNGYRLFKLAAAAIDLGIPERLGDGPKTADELSRATGTNPDALRRALRTLAAWGAVRETEDGAFAANEVTALLARGTSGGVGDMLVMLDREYRAWDELPYVLRTGEPGYPRAFGMSRWEYLRSHPADAEEFNRAMVSVTARIAEGVARAYDFSSAKTVADIGGGSGALLSGILRANPRVRGIVFDLESGLLGARESLGAAGVLERCELRVGDFFSAAPPADVQILKSIIHDWPDADAVRILASCRRSLPPTGRVLLVERRLPERMADDLPSRTIAMTDMNMLVNFGARERTAGEYARLFERAGLRAGSVTPIDEEWAIFEALPV